MALTLEQYANWLDGRGDLVWPARPTIEMPKARPHLERLPGVRAVSLSVYGTLIAIAGGELYFVHPEKFIMEAALEKTIQEFKMWKSMSRKPGKPSEYMRHIYEQILDEARMARSSGSERHPEIRSDDVWERIVKRLMKNEYQFDVGFYGSLNQFSEKISYFFHASIQGTGLEAGACEALAGLREKGVHLGLLAVGQCFTRLQLSRALRQENAQAELAKLLDEGLIALSYEVGAKKPSEALFRAFLSRLAARQIAPDEVLHVGSKLTADIAPAKRLGFRTALFAGDKASLEASKEQLQERSHRPDILITDLRQLVPLIG